MATNSEGYEMRMAELATTRIDAESLNGLHPVIVHADLVPGGDSPPALVGPALRQEPAPVPQEVDNFFQLPAEQRPDTSSADPAPEGPREVLPEWAWAALLAGCAEMGERRRR